MTEQIQKLTPEEKRIRIAEACGWVKLAPFLNACGGLTQEWRHPDPVGHRNCTAGEFDYLDDLNAALTLIDFLAERGWRCNLANGLDKTWECEFMRPPTDATDDDDIGSRQGERLEIRYAPAATLAEAICDGFLLAHTLMTPNDTGEHRKP